MKGRDVTIAEVARHAGVAVSTVSYVLSGKRAISAETRRRVLDSVRALGYHPNAGARALASKRANVIALVLPLRAGMHVPVLMQFATSVVTAARSFDHDVLLLTADEGTDGIRRAAASALVDGLILMDIEEHDERVPVLRELSEPTVLIGFPADSAGLTCVDLDFEAAGKLCVAHLAGRGHREIALLGAPAVVYERGTGFARRTRSGFADAIEARGLSGVALPCEEGFDDVRVTVKQLLADHPQVTGLVVHNEAAVGHVLATLRELDRQLEVVAICPDDIADRARLASVLIPAEEVGREAVRLLMEKLEGRQVPASTLLQPRLTYRRA
ncbi:LacI family DNA-binding transcriptional regulator [Nonomuraea soli]|uniref:DNA-binding LacI/PurR family transcriptional regulator n=1 Tax=Nonomuraea soli TaxID=1032476 RepID=A0A7W0HR00_9ACTN|nr:LacI family DNA-binding transcriptional regulator [Nonomuraea soli]MBA2892493.1 DNA-binding LacI/PurR family transcriptional regulator [Nonomuraea soli]